MDKVKGNGNCLFSRENVFKYARTVGVISYAGLGVAVSQPGVLRSRQFDLTNSLLLGSIVGTTAFIYERSHLKEIKPRKRLWISIYGSGLFNFGSLLMWAIVRSATQDYNLHPIFRGFLSLAASYYMVQSGLSWVEIIDKN